VSAGPTLYNATFLQSVMGNLLRNAAHYTDGGYIRLSLEPNGFSVEDSGVGIPEEQREAMFRRSCAVTNGVARAGLGCRWCSGSVTTRAGASP
jgi:K+-sensing histidine kinase KdpD